MQSAARIIHWITRWQTVASISARGWCLSALCILQMGAVAQAASAGEDHGCSMPTYSAEQLKKLDVYGWIERMRHATELQTYSGTFVVMSSSGVMSSSRVWHVCKKNSQIERIEALSGTPRIVYRQNADVRTFTPQERVVRVESREMPSRLPRAQGIDARSLAEHYVAQLNGQERIAGREADVLQLRPSDALRFGHRIWLDHQTGLVLKWQTIAPSGRVLEQAAFSDLTLSTPVSGEQIAAMMNDVVGYRVIRERRWPSTLESSGWQLPIPVGGFVLLNCAQKEKMATQPPRTAKVQCVYSDGLTSISVFIEPYREDRHPYDGQELRLGATHTLSARVAGDGWATMVGEVPLATLRLFASAIKQTSY